MMLLDIVRDDGQDDYDLINGQVNGRDADLMAVMEGRATTRNQKGEIEDRFYLVGRSQTGTQQVNVVNGTVLLNKIGEQARHYRDDTSVPYAYWLREMAQGENRPRRALVRDVMLRQLDEGQFTRLQNLGYTVYELVVAHLDWESEEARTLLTADMVVGDALEIPAGGTLTGRISRLKLKANGTTPTSFTQIYVGIRPYYYGVSDFVGQWDTTDGTLGDDAIVDLGLVKIDFATEEGLVPRITLKLSDILASGNYDHFAGEYTLVANVTIVGGTNPKWGILVTGDGVQSEEVYGGDAGAYLLELGSIAIPSHTRRNVSVPLDDIEIVLLMEVIGGSPPTLLTIGKIYAIPNKHTVKLEDATLDGADLTSFTEFRVLPDGRVLQYNYDGSAYTFSAPAPSNLVIPREGGILVLTAYRADNTLSSDWGMAVELEVVDRWEGYRNA